MRFLPALLGAFLLLIGIVRRAEAQPSYKTDIAPLLQKRCVACHTASSEGRAAPFALTSYADAARRGRQLVQVTQTGYMPPWKTTTPGFLHQRGLTEPEKDVIKRWVDSGAPEGASVVLPSQKTSIPVPAWPFGKPDLILTMLDTYPLAANTNEVSRCFVLPTGLTQDKWVRAVAFRPSNPRIVRFASLYLDTNGQGRQQQSLSGSVGFYAFASGLRPLPQGTLADWSVGAGNMPFLSGVAVKLPQNSDLILQVRFQPTGKPETERMQIGLYFSPPQKEMVTLRLGVAELYLPRQATATQTDEYTLPVDSLLMEVTPNFHPVAQKISVKAESPEGKIQEILEIPDWDAAWKQAYRPETPVRLLRGTRLTLRVSYDNTETNPRNPWKPSHRVVPSLEFMEEMGSVWLRLLPVRPEDAATLRASLPVKPRSSFYIDELEPEGKPRPRPQPGPPVKTQPAPP